MGEAGTGKSCLIKRYCEEKFVAKYISTIGVDFGGDAAQPCYDDVFWCDAP
jgi:GTPase SAR1 family protein